MIDIDRINFLAKKAKEIGLTEKEKLEQQKLRREYIDSIKANIKAQLGDVNEYKNSSKDKN